jgi:polyribonucleotide nucleotidyltransferase
MEYSHIWKAVLGDRDVELKVGPLAQQAHGAVLIQEGETVLLATAVVSDKPRDGVDFMPLMVDYEEKFYAAGKINGSRYIKREGRPSDGAVLTSRLIDRAIRPLFPKSFRRDVQVIVTVLSIDEDNDPDTLAITAASAALIKAETAPFQGPVGAVRIGRIDNQLIVNPKRSDMDKSDLDLVVAGTSERVMMIEAGANEVPDDVLYEAIELAQRELQSVVKAQEELAASKEIHVTVEEEAADAAYELVKSHLGSEINNVADQIIRGERQAAFDALKEKALVELEGQMKQNEILAGLEKVYFKRLRANILENDKRPDGRAITEIRQIWCDSSLLPRTHGSAVFTRGESQSLSIVTLASPGAKQMIDTMDQDGEKRYMHHYNFPPYSTGETSPLRGAGRREIGHGALAERALMPMIPDEESFPYTIRVVSEILSSNGSTSMAATCGSTLSLMDAGVPLKKPVSGIAMGLITNHDASEYKVLSDLQGLEDFCGDMDFKIAGTADGITAVQMDTKIKGLTMEIIRQTVTQAKEGRAQILAKMLEHLPEPRADLSKYAPRIVSVKINPEKIGELIGPGGKMINKIIDSCGGKEVTNIDIEDTGLVMITSNDPEMAQKAIAAVEGIGKDVQIGEEFDGEVVGVVNNRDTGKEIGALVEISPTKTGMVHISEISWNHIAKIADALTIGQKVRVKVLDVDPARGKIGLSIRALEPKPEGYVERPREERPRGFGDRPPFRGGPRRDNRR